MASIITATTTSGLTQSADNSGVLQLASSVGNLVTIPSVTGTAMVSGNMPAFFVTLSTNFSVTSGSYTKVPFDTKTFDTATCFNTSTNRFTPTVAGYYQINLTVGNGGSVTRAIAGIYKNGSELCRGFDATAAIAGCSASAIVFLNGSTDYIEGYGLLSGAALVFFGASVVTQMSGVLVRGA